LPASSNGTGSTTTWIRGRPRRDWSPGRPGMGGAVCRPKDGPAAERRSLPADDAAGAIRSWKRRLRHLAGPIRPRIRPRHSRHAPPPCPPLPPLAGCPQMPPDDGRRWPGERLTSLQPVRALRGSFGQGRICGQAKRPACRAVGRAPGTEQGLCKCLCNVPNVSASLIYMQLNDPFGYAFYVGSCVRPVSELGKDIRAIVAPVKGSRTLRWTKALRPDIATRSRSRAGAYERFVFDWSDRGRPALG